MGERRRRDRFGMGLEPPDWFNLLFGFREHHGGLKERLEVLDHGRILRSKENEKEYRVGAFDTPSLGELRDKVAAKVKEGVPGDLKGQPTFGNVVGDVSEFMCDKKNVYSTFQVASQFNCLEFVGPDVKPEHGVTGYSEDRTQGPCCSIACGAATVYRNYFAPVKDPKTGQVQQGQSEHCQIENLRQLSDKLGNHDGKYFKVINGYTLAHMAGLKAMNDEVLCKPGITADAIDEYRKLLRVGVQEDAEVTATSWGQLLVNDKDQQVTQVFGSACSVAYSDYMCERQYKENVADSLKLWNPISQLVLEASYEATLLVTILRALEHNGKGGSRTVFLTALGGGVFGNSMEWIVEALRRAIREVSKFNIKVEVQMINYAPPPDHRFEQLAREVQEEAEKAPPEASSAGAAGPPPLGTIPHTSAAAPSESMSSTKAQPPGHSISSLSDTPPEEPKAALPMMSKSPGGGHPAPASTTGGAFKAAATAGSSAGVSTHAGATHA